MHLFQNTSIQRKQMLVIMLTSVLSLLLACVGFVAYEIIAFRQSMVRNLTTLAQIVGDNSSGALDFNDPKSAQDVLLALHAEPNIVAACTYTKDGQEFAVYRRADATRVLLPAMTADGYRFDDNGYLILSHHITQKGDTVGSVCLQSDLREMSVRLKRYISIVGIMLFASTLAAFLLSTKLQRWLSEPILHLAKTARAVALEKNYALRATKQNEDELGKLTDDFNTMLAQIQQQDAALQAANEGLERRVEERTADLQREIAERRHIEAALRNSEEQMRLLLNSTTEAIYGVDGDGNCTFCNPACIRMLGYDSAQDLIGKNIHALAHHHYADGREYPIDECPILESFRQNEGVHVDNEVLWRRDSACFPAEYWSHPIHRDGKPIGCVVAFVDITERKRAESDLEKMHRQLQEASRQAGMAEVATNVLHNVGNVLNSVNVSAALASEQIRNSKGVNLTKLAALFQEHKDDLAAFLTSDPKGTQVPGYLVTLAERMAEERALVLKELQSLSTNIEHIKDIVAMQQSYSKLSGVIEPLRLVDLVEDALRMNMAALGRHGAQVVREFTEVPPVLVEKHKVLQILVNLIRNAKYALDEAAHADKCLTVRIAQNGTGFAHVSVTDNGIGIPPENLTRIFAHGFTTRKDGHGFGLHSAALAAKELGGRLTAQSDGAGKGATFILELPLQVKERNHG
jgi:PAS domain S-box-containing protein